VIGVSVKTPQSAWKNYTAKELCAQFDLSAQELAECAAGGLILPPAPRHKGPPYTEMDYLRLDVFKRCTEAGYSLDEVLDLIGRIHRRTAPIKTIILAKAFADDKLAELEDQLATGDTLEKVNLRCDADILKRYIEALVRLQKGMGNAVEKKISTLPLKPNPALQAPPAGERIKKQPKAKKQASKHKKQTYPRPYGAMAEETRNLWKQATPGGRKGTWIALIVGLLVVCVYLLYDNGTFDGLLTHEGENQVSSSVEEINSDQDTINTPQPPLPLETLPLPAKVEPKDPKPAAAKKSKPLLQTATDDLEKIMAASDETAAATSSDLPRIIQLTELVVFYDIKTRIIRVKIELLKNLLADVPQVIRGRIFIVLRSVDETRPGVIITLPSGTLIAHTHEEYYKHGAPFTLENEFTTYLKTQISFQPSIEQTLTLFIFDQNRKLLLRESQGIKLKLIRS
jgi:DNA-binding transcriptional MerR regulator